MPRGEIKLDEDDDKLTTPKSVMLYLAKKFKLKPTNSMDMIKGSTGVKIIVEDFINKYIRKML